MITTRLLFLCISFLYMTNSYAGNKDTYEYLPQIPIPALRKIIREYVCNKPTYRVKSFIFQFDCANTDKLPCATIQCIQTDTSFRWHSRQYSLIVTPADKQFSAMHVDCHDQNSNELKVPPVLQSDSAFNQEYKPMVRYKHGEEDSVLIIFEKQRMLHRLNGQYLYDCIHATPDNTLTHDALKTANEVLKKARFDE